MAFRSVALGACAATGRTAEIIIRAAIAMPILRIVILQTFVCRRILNLGASFPGKHALGREQRLARFILASTKDSQTTGKPDRSEERRVGKECRGRWRRER